MAVIGGGPAGLIAAETLGARGVRVTVHDAMPSVGRKFLIAGRGGLNLTHSEPFETFVARYGASAARLEPCLGAVPPKALIAWAEGLGQATFVGSSGRVFPRAMKASPLLRAWLGRLAGLGVRFRTRDQWLGWDAGGALMFRDRPPEGADAVILALGGASWPRLGSTGAWAGILAARGVAISPFQPANCGFSVDWSQPFRDRFSGAPIKPLAVRFGGRTVRGEAVVTRDGLEGGAIYALGPAPREALARDGRAVLELDLSPDLAEDALALRLARPRGGQSRSNILRKAARLSPVAANLLREAYRGDLPGAVRPEALAGAIKRAPIALTGVQGLERAISSAGGVAWSAVDAGLMLKDLPGVFVAGEMLDWEAPTGGYLLQACFATGVAAATGALAWLGEFNPPPPPPISEFRPRRSTGR